MTYEEHQMRIIDALYDELQRLRKQNEELRQRLGMYTDYRRSDSLPALLRKQAE